MQSSVLLWVQTVENAADDKTCRHSPDHLSHYGFMRLSAEAVCSNDNICCECTTIIGDSGSEPAIGVFCVVNDVHTECYGDA